MKLKIDRICQQKPALVSRQHGVVLVFSMITLLLLTLLSVNMIQQNRLEFMMAGNAQTQTEDFSSAESLLKIAENYIDIWHSDYSVKCDSPTTNLGEVTYQCDDGNQKTYTSSVQNQDPDKLYLCEGFDSQEVDDLLGADENPDTPEWEITEQLGLQQVVGSSVSITSVSCIVKDMNNEVICKDGSQAGLSEESPCNSIGENCATVLYNVKVVSKMISTSVERSIEAKYGVRCDH